MTTMYIPTYLMRGGTSKGLFFLKADLPEEPELREQYLLQAIGSPDPYGKQLDGVGGATPSTSKIAIISKSDKADFDINYLFGQVAIKEATIDYSWNCGNLSSAVGVYAIEKGLVKGVKNGTTIVRVWQENLQKELVINVKTDNNGLPETQGDYNMAGVPNPGSPIAVEFIKPQLAGFDRVLPTGNPIDKLDIADLGPIDVTIISAGNNTVFIRAKDFQLRGDELPLEIDSNHQLLEKLENIRCQAAVKIGTAPNALYAHSQLPSTPKIALIAGPQKYTNTPGTTIASDKMDIHSRILSMGKAHHAYTGTGAIAAAVASQIPGSIVAESISKPLNDNMLRLAHPAGTMDVSAQVEIKGGRYRAKKATLFRTARTLMRGEVSINL